MDYCSQEKMRKFYRVYPLSPSVKPFTRNYLVDRLIARWVLIMLSHSMTLVLLWEKDWEVCEETLWVFDEYVWQ